MPSGLAGARQQGATSMHAAVDCHMQSACQIARVSGLAPGFLSVAIRGAAKKQRATAPIPGKGSSAAVPAGEFAELKR